MERTISSKQTFFMKIVFPVLWLPALFYITLTALFDTSGTYNLPRPIILLVLVIITASVYWFCIRLKRVKVFGNSLLVSNYWNEVQIPLSDIQNITENVWVNIHPVTIHLKRSFGFGNKIVFMPTFRVFGFWRSHPIVKELMDLARSKKF